MKLKMVSVVVVLAAIFAFSAIEVQAQDQCVFWLKVYGQAPAVANLTFGGHLGNSIGLDTAASFPTAFKEQEPPPPPPGFDCIWIKYRPTQPFGSFRGLLDRDFHDLVPSVKDTFKVKFVQNDNSSSPVSLKWPDAAYLMLRCDAAAIKYLDPVLGSTTLDMFAQDSLFIDAAGDNGVLDATIYITGMKPVSVDLVNPAVPETFQMNQNYPNPFNPTTTIIFDIKNLSVTDISVYNILGQKVATLVSSVLSPGEYKTVWNGTTDNGLPVTSGVYFARLNARIEGTGESFTAMRKLLLMK